MHTIAVRLLALALLMMGATAGAQTPTAWVAGKHYFPVQGPQQVSVAPGKIEVTEAFSYACPACNQFYSTMEQLRKSLPANAEVVYLPASFRADENWPMFQRAFYTAQVLKLVDKTHEEMFKAIWTTGELGIIDQKTRRPKKSMPTIEDAARFYNRITGVDTAKFLSAAKGFSVEGKVLRANKLVRDYGVESTPTIIVNGRYRLTVGSAGGVPQMIELVNWLVAKETLQRSANVSR